MCDVLSREDLEKVRNLNEIRRYIGDITAGGRLKFKLFRLLSFYFYHESVINERTRCCFFKSRTTKTVARPTSRLYICNWWAARRVTNLLFSWLPKKIFSFNTDKKVATSFWINFAEIRSCRFVTHPQIFIGKKILRFFYLRVYARSLLQKQWNWFSNANVTL